MHATAVGACAPNTDVPALEIKPEVLVADESTALQQLSVLIAALKEVETYEPTLGDAADRGSEHGNRPVDKPHYRLGLITPRLIIERALVAIVKEAHIQGLSPRSIHGLLRATGMTGALLESEVERICTEVDDRIISFLDRRLACDWPHLWFITFFMKIHSQAPGSLTEVTIAVGADSVGHREALGMSIGPSPPQSCTAARSNEAPSFELLRTLERRGLSRIGQMRPYAPDNRWGNDKLTTMVLPAYIPPSVHSTSLVCRLGDNIKRRTEVVDIFPDERSLVRLVGSILFEQNEEWSVQGAPFAAPQTIRPPGDDPMITLIDNGSKTAEQIVHETRDKLRPHAVLSRATWRMEGVPPEQAVQSWYQNKKLAQEEYAQGRTTLTSRPVWVSFDTGSVCNLRCVQCPRENPGINFEEQRTDQRISQRVLGVLPHLERLTLYGLGEPLLSDVFWTIIEQPETKIIPHVDISTNGTLLSEKNVERLLQSNLTFLKVSIDGATADTYKRIRRGNLNKVLQGVQRLTTRRRELGRSDFRVWLSMTLMLENIRELPMMIDLACELGVDAVWAQHLLMRSDGTMDNWSITHGEWTFVYNEQHLSNAPALNNEMVRLAKEKADQRGFNFELDPALWLPE